MMKALRFVLLTATSLGVAAPALVALAPVAYADPAPGAEKPPKQVALTQQQIDHLIAAQPGVRAVESAAPQDKPDPAAEAKVAAVVKKSGFADISEFADVSYSVGLVMAGMDPDTKTFVGPAAVLGKEIKQVEADSSMPPKEKKETLAELNGALKESSGDKPQPENITIVKANFDKLVKALQQPD